MIKRLYLDNCFTHQDRTFDFAKGITGVVGKNESGKSLIVEMIRYALFGTAALRGTASDYKGLHVELDFTVGAKNYTVTRKSNKVSLSGDSLEVTGTHPVNEAIQRILGYDLMVFDVANACNQGDIEALSNMRPADRKRMVDRTIGLDVLDKVSQFCGDEGNAKKREAEGFARVLNAPEKPEDYNYRPSDVVRRELETARGQLTRFNELKGQLSVSPEKPKRPPACKIKQTAEVLRTQQDDLGDVLGKIQRYERELKSLELPSLDGKEIGELGLQWDCFDLWTEKKRLLDKGENECPSCGHSWPLEIDQLKDFEEVQEVAEPKVSRGELVKQRNLLNNLPRVDELTEILNSLQASLPEDVSADLQIRQAYEAEYQMYKRQKEAFDRYNEGLEDRQAEFESLAGTDTLVTQLTEEHETTSRYEVSVAHYEKAQKIYESNLETHTQLEAQAQDYFKARKNIQALKTQVKTFLLPSLNKVASHLLSQMTGGERSEILVDESFEIQVDGQGINTLSGSGKAVANLAIRIALGQILTNRVFSVFMADEVDAAMDDDRASYTAQALNRLAQTVDQVVLITHKRPETDQLIELTK